MPEIVLIDQLLTVVELLDGGPDEFLAPDLVLLLALVETVLGTIASQFQVVGGLNVYITVRTRNFFVFA